MGGKGRRQLVSVISSMAWLSVCLFAAKPMFYAVRLRSGVVVNLERGTRIGSFTAPQLPQRATRRLFPSPKKRFLF